MMKSFREYYQQIFKEEDISQCLDFYKQIFIEEQHDCMNIHDVFTEHALQYVIKDNGKVVAAYRIIPGSSKFDFPVGEFTEIPLLNERRYAEASRFAIHADYRGGVISIAKTFADLTWRGKNLGISHFLGQPRLELVTFYERFGFKRYGAPFLDPSISSDNGKPNSILILVSVDELYKRYFGEGRLELRIKP
jgi:predicted GNAT family N-acyltransferase